MLIDFILPDIGEGIVECEVVEWKIAEGDMIVEDQIVADVSTDKAIVEIPSMYTGRVSKLYYQQEEIAVVHTPLFAVEVADDGKVSAPAAADEPVPDTIVSIETTAIGATAIGATDRVSESAAGTTSSNKVLSTPAVRKIARENNLDLSTVTATGKNGRVLKEDVLSYLAGSTTSTGSHSSADKTLTINKVEAIKGVRALMAQRMSDSVNTIPHFTFAEEIDLTELIELRLRLKAQYASDELKITMMPLFIKALSLAMKQFPVLNSRANEDFSELTYLAEHNIGMAVDGKTGLLVPNVKNVEKLNILQVAAEVTRLTGLARSGKISLKELSGGTITISNVGAIGGTVATPIINKPEVAIVALGRVQKLPRFNVQGQVEARQIMTVSWSGDHRVIDGGTISRFNNLWKQYLEAPSSMLVAMS